MSINPLPYLLAFITGKPRYRPNIEWSHLWTFNFFRLYELLFWRTHEVRVESAISASRTHEGNLVVTEAFYTLEALLVHWECRLRREFSFENIRILQPAAVGARMRWPTGIMMAVAYDAPSNKSATATTITVSHTCTGTDRYLTLMGGGRATVSSASYNSVATSSIGAASSGVVRCGMHGLLNPASGANTLSVTFSSGTNAQTMGGVSFSGAGAISGANTGSGSSTTASVTVSSVSGSVCVDAMDHGDQGIATATGSGQTARWTSGAGSDANGMSTIAGAASVTFSWTRPTSSVWAIVGVSVDVPVAFTITAPRINDALNAIMQLYENAKSMIINV